MDLKPGRAGSPRTEITSKTLLILDESAMIATRQLSELVRVAGSGKIVMVGDSKQLQSIEGRGRRIQGHS